MQAVTEFAPTVAGLKQFLASCPSVSLAVAVGGELSAAASTRRLAAASPLTMDLLKEVCLRLYDRPHAAGGSDDVFLLSAEALQGGRPKGGEDQLRFVDALMGQLAEGQKLNFQRAFAQATR